MSDRLSETPAETIPHEDFGNAPETEAPAASVSETDHPEYEDFQEPEASGFAALGLSEPVLRAIADKGYTNPTPIQAEAIPIVLMGRDVMGVAQTGTGKTAGFTLPMLDILDGSRARARMPRALILEPTRELALQVAEQFQAYGKYLKLTHALVIGGESLNDQRDILARGVDVVIATPGRLIDLFERGGMLLTDAKFLVIDEADRMLDMGFIPDVERIVQMLPANRQTLFFSATMAPEIRRLADAFLQNPKQVTVSKAASVATTIVSGLVVVEEHDKREALRRLIRAEKVGNALIFCNRKRDVDILLKSLTRHEFSVGALHGDMAQSVRFATLEKFKANQLQLLVCSDVAARGLDIGGLSHVFNFDVPTHAEDFVHRIGRTGRAGLTGHAFTLASPDDREMVEAIEKLTGFPIPRITVPGLDPVEWAEGGRKRRGRRGAKPEEKRAERPERTERAERKPRAPKPQIAEAAVAVPETADGPPATDSRPPRRERDRRDARPPREARRDAGPPRAEPRPEARREERPDPSRNERPETRRDDRRPRHHDRADDLGPAVTGFGDSIPAFMLLPMRKRTAEPSDTGAHITEDAA